MLCCRLRLGRANACPAGHFGEHDEQLGYCELKNSSIACLPLDLKDLLRITQVLGSVDNNYFVENANNMWQAAR